MKNKSTILFTIALFILFGFDKVSIAGSDSVLKYSTYLGPRSDFVFYTNYVGLGVDESGCTYVSTSVTEKDFPLTPDALQTTRSETAISKLSADGSKLIYSSCFGKPDTWTRAYDMAVDHEGNAYLVGIMTSGQFPTTPNAYHAKPIGPYPRKYKHDGFLVKLDPTLKKVIFGTYIGQALVLDRHKNLYIAGTTRSTDFPTTEGAFERTHSGFKTKKFGGDVFVCKFNFQSLIHLVK